MAQAALAVAQRQYDLARAGAWAYDVKNQEEQYHALTQAYEASKRAADVAAIQQAVARLGYVALTKDQFIARIADFYTYKTGVGTNLMVMTIISFLVGLSISGQTFFTFILENLEKFGALKAIGAKGRELVYMILFQASFTALTGYGLGVGLCALMIWIARLRLPDYAAVITCGNLGIAFAMVLVIAGLSSYIGIRKVLKIEPFDIFRG